MDHAISLIISAILFLATLVLNLVGDADSYLAALMISAHVPADAQAIVLLLAAVVLVVLAIRLLGRIFAALIVVLLVLLLVRHTFPKLEIPQPHPPASAVHLNL